MPATLSNSTKTYSLNNGAVIPAIGLGTWRATNEGDAQRAVAAAIVAGYRHIDAAWAYGNEKEVGVGIKEGLAATGLERKDIFVTTKLWGTFHHDPEAALDISLERLGLDYVDQYMMHWPVALNPNGKGAETGFPVLPSGKRDILLDWSFVKSYENLQKTVVSGKAKAIGVSNFSIKNLKTLLAAETTKIKPICNQVEAHPYLPQPKLLAYCKSEDILITAYSPLGSIDSPLLQDETVVAIAKKNGVSVAQVLISWALWRGTAVLPKSVSAARIASNLQVFELSNEDGEALNQISVTKGSQRLISPDWSPVVIFEDED
ncbi:hypothetical protein BABINDRAFT_161761 [Babjeviella inositovora NRRL Y-12698]|uniref:2-dehydropantolactone reductase n=1 Tax=Babjeviella inositovora NRRL Y-12698 TaxID=984486 RepID=A0A1E3QNT6_9ASCO|nr:uncharacterized protein BABINDRAFT_161761 [Babjeviella inositovora NRRL Y-12698]ODQ79353.1 hypothetical protein BABINDRAFT_161761 [Babjeviella inositovora NRRL Y-12698]